MHAIQCITTNNFLEKFKGGVIHNRYVVRVPTYRTADMQHQFGDKEEHGRYLVGSALRGMEVPGIDGDELLVLHAVAYTEFIGTYCIALQTDAKYFRFETILHVFIFRGKYPVEGVLKEGTVLHTVHSDILATVMYPQVHDTWVTLAAPHLFGNGTATLGMLYPKVTDTFIGIGQCKVSTLGVGERSGVEVKLHLVFGSPLHPAFKVFHLYLVAVYKRSAKISINLVQIQAVLAGDIGSGFQDIPSQFFHRASLARIVARGLDTACQ